MTAAEPGQHLAKLCSGPLSHPTLLPNRWRKRTGKVLLNSPDGVAQKEDGALGVTLRVGVMLKGSLETQQGTLNTQWDLKDSGI